MPNLFDHIFGPGWRPVRRDFEFRITFNKHGNPTVLPENGDCHGLSKDGSLDGSKFKLDAFFSCGHPMSHPLGGQCIECERLSCLACFCTCQGCRCPLCRRCGIVAQFGQDPEITLCSSCYGAMKRRRWIRGLLSPFVRFADSNSHQNQGGR